MKTIIQRFAAAFLLLLTAAGPATTPATSASHFKALDIYINSGAQPLAAYQFDLKSTTGGIDLVGVEGGEHAFAAPPYYDPKALLDQRVVIAAFNTGTDLPSGKTRVARLMLRITRDVKPQFEIKLKVAAGADGKEIPATVQLLEGAL